MRRFDDSTASRLTVDVQGAGPGGSHIPVAHDMIATPANGAFFHASPWLVRGYLINAHSHEPTGRPSAVQSHLGRGVVRSQGQHRS